MPVTNPCCCGCSLQTGTKVVGLLNVILTFLATKYLIVAIFQYGQIASRGTQNDEELDHDVVVGALAVAIISLIIVVIRLIVNIVLLVGARKKHYGKCRIWFIVSVIFLVLFTLKSLVEIVMGGVAGGFDVASGSIFEFVIGFAVEAYMIWVVHAFMEELKEGVPVSTSTVVLVDGPRVPSHNYIYTPPPDDHDSLPPSYSESQEGYVPVSLNNPQRPCFPSAPEYTPQSGFNFRLDAEKGRNY